jgi:hypothetical protein
MLELLVLLKKDVGFFLKGFCFATVVGGSSIQTLCLKTVRFLLSSNKRNYQMSNTFHHQMQTLNFGGLAENLQIHPLIGTNFYLPTKVRISEEECKALGLHKK